MGTNPTSPRTAVGRDRAPMADPPVERAARGRSVPGGSGGPRPREERSGPSDGDLRAKVSRGSTNQGVLAAVTQVLSLAQTVVLARVFAPEDFGSLACALAYVHFFCNTASRGIGKNLVRRKNLNEKTIGTAWTLSLARDGVLLGAYLAGVVPFAMLFGDDAFLLHLLFLAPVVFQNTFELPAAFLEREFRFRAANLPRLIDLVVYPVIALALYFGGYGAHALFVAFVSSFLISRASLWVLHPLPMKFRYDRQVARSMLRFVWPMMLATTVSFLATRLDDLFVNYFAGEAQLGYYALAFYKPMFIIGVVLMMGQVLYPALARVRTDAARTRTYFTEGSKYLAMFVFPAGLLVAVFAEPVVVLLFSDKWLPAAGLLRLFSIGIAIRVGMTALWMPLLMAHGRTRATLAASLVDLVLLLVFGLPTIAAFGAVGGAWYFVAHAAVSVWIVPLPAVRSILGDLSHLRALLLPAGAAILGAAVGLALESKFDYGLAGLAAKAAVAFGAYLGVIFVCDRATLVEAWRFVRLAAPRDREAEASA